MFFNCVLGIHVKSDMSELSVLISLVPSIRSRRAVSNGGPHLSVAYDLTCFTTVFCFWKKMFEKYMNEAVDSTISQISSSCAE